MCFLFGRKKILARQQALEEKIDKLTEDLKKTESSVKETVTTATNTSSNSLVGGVKMTLDAVTANINNVLSNNEKRIAEMRESLDKNLGEIRQDNEKRLAEMRQVVEEKLTATLGERLSQTVSAINEQLDKVSKGLGEMQNLTTGVTDLRRMLGNVKARGTLGEVSLENILSNILTAEQYSSQFNLSAKATDGRKIVDFAVILPGQKGEEKVFLPIDAKFPLEDYQKLVDASEKADAEKTDEYSKALMHAVKLQAKSIRDNYIMPPKTVDFALMYLPIEGLYAEVVRTPALLEELRTKYKVIPVGPTTISALLNSLQLGFRTLAVQKSSREIFDQLVRFQKDFGKFVELLGKAQNQIGTLGKTLEEATKKTDMIQKNLNKIERIAPPEETQTISLTTIE